MKYLKRMKTNLMYLLNQCLVKGDYINKILITIAIICISNYCWSSEEENIDQDPEQKSDYVEYIKIPDALDSYKKRRMENGYIFKLSATEITNSLYISDIDEEFYENIFKHSFTLYEAKAGYKMNFSLGSLSLEAGAGYGSIDANAATADRKLSVTKYNLGTTLMFDMLFDEPLVVPFIYLEVYKTEYEEGISSSTITKTKTYETPENYSYSAGVMLQLNKLEKVLGIDEELSERAYNSYGLQNTFLSLAVTDINASKDGNEPLGTDDYLYTVGLGLEF